MENENSGELVVNEASRQGPALCGESGSRFDAAHGVKEELKRIVHNLVERFGLTKEDLVSAYDECIAERNDAEVRVEKNESQDDAAFVQHSLQQHVASNCSNVGLQVNGESALSDGGIMDAQEDRNSTATVDDAEDDAEEEMEDEQIEKEKENGSQLESVIDNKVEEKEEVDKMQTLVQSALRVYEATSMTPEIGQKRRCFTLEDELSLQPSSFAQELLEWVSHAVIN